MMTSLQIVPLILLYAFLPPVLLFFTTKMIFKGHRKEGVYLQYALKFLFVISFLPLLSLSELDLGLIPQSPVSLYLLVSTLLFGLLGFIPALKRKQLFYYTGGLEASFMEEVLYRGILFSLLQLLTTNIFVVIAINSLLFGLWHLKNYYWSGKKYTIAQFFYTAIIYGPLFCLARLYTGDLYLAIFIHFLNDAFFALAPNSWLKYTSSAGREELFQDGRLP